MTARQIWENMLTELSKVHAPSMLLQDFNYFLNKAVNQYINKRYNIYDINLQTSDDLRVLKATSILDVAKTEVYNKQLKETAMHKLFGATYEVTLPPDYLHILNCVCIYKVKQTYKCYDKNDYVQFAAKRLTADSWSIILNDFYNRPLPERPYFYIHNVNIQNDFLPTNPLTINNPAGTDLQSKYDYGDTVDGEVGDESNLPRTIQLVEPNGSGTKNRITSLVEKEIGLRASNSSSVRMEIRYGLDDSVFELQKVFIDYIKSPQVIRLTLDLVNRTLDTSQIMEFPDYVCQEIINELTMLVMENTADPRLLSNIAVTKSIATPAQQLTQQPTAVEG